MIPVIIIAAVVIVLLASYFIFKAGKDQPGTSSKVLPVDTTTHLNDSNAVTRTDTNTVQLKDANAIHKTSLSDQDTTHRTEANNTKTAYISDSLKIDAAAAGLTAQDMMQKAAGAKANNDYETAMYWYRNAAIAGNKQAKINMGIFTDPFSGEKPNLDSAIYWYLLAAGNMATGSDTKQGIAYIHQAASQGNAACMQFLGHLYMIGIPQLPKDDEQAVVWLKKASDLGSHMAKGFYGVMLYEGRGGLTPILCRVVR